MSAAFRLPTGGRIRRDQPLQFTFNGEAVQGFGGDTVASALLAQGKHLVARSFKYHRPRGIMAAGIEEPNALMTLGQGNRQEPNVAATVIEAHKDLQVRTQNAWPSVGFDLMAINSLLSPMFVAGFYYKTFMGPTRKAWMFYEHFIRKAAGLGTATEDADPDRYDWHHVFADLLVIGSGPAGHYYYLRVIKTMYFDATAEGFAPSGSVMESGLIALAAAVTLLGYGLIGPLGVYAGAAAKALF